MDFITGLPRVQGRDCIFVVVNRLTKFAHLFEIPMDYKAIQVAELFFREVFRLHGLPKQIVNDRDGRFINTIWQELFWLTDTKLATSTSYYPQTDGQIEIVNKWVEGYLRNYMGGQQQTWVSIVTTRHTICLSRCHHLEHCMDTMHPLLLILYSGIAGSQWPKIELRRAKGFCGQ
jgi:hypothetical protein